MASRAFRLPNIEELNKDQERVRLLPPDGCYLVVGGPGTGKSVVALLRARRLHRASGSRGYVFLAYNRLLLEASRELSGGGINAEAWIGWFKRVFEAMLNQPCPEGANRWDLRWKDIEQAIAEVGELPDAAPPHLIIDEGQDMPPDFYKALTGLGFEHFFVVADQNQRITEQHSKLSEIEDLLAIDPADRIELQINYRNPYQVGLLARHLAPDDPASPRPELPPDTRSTRTPVMIPYGPGTRYDFSRLVDSLLKAADRDPERLIGVVTPDNATRNAWVEALRNQPAILDHGRPRVVTYASGERGGDHRLSVGGIFVLNAQSVKGLEFDTVVLADIHRYRVYGDRPEHLEDLRRRFYVMVSRARERVFLLRRADLDCPAEPILPEDTGLLERWS